MFNAYSIRREFKFGFLLGKNIDDLKVLSHLERIGYVHRIIEEDGVNLPIKLYVRFNRLDIRLRDNKIIDF